MATPLKTKPGINGANVLSIPTEWDATWFRKFLNNSLKGADVRNAIGINGVTVTGNIASPYATISGGGSPFVAPIVINPTTGQVSLTVNGAPGQNALVVNGPSALTAPVTIAATTGQVSLTVNGASGQFSVTSNANAQSAFVANGGSFLQNSTTGAAAFVMNATGPNFGQIYSVGVTQQWALGAGPSNITAGNKALTWTDGSGTLPCVQILGNGSGTTSVFSGPSRALLQLDGNNDSLIDFSHNGASQGYLFASAAAGTFDMNTPTGNTLRLQTANATALSINATGQIALPLVTVTSTSPVAGGAGALPATPAGYMAVTIAGVARRIPFYT